MFAVPAFTYGGIGMMARVALAQAGRDVFLTRNGRFKKGTDPFRFPFIVGQ